MPSNGTVTITVANTGPTNAVLSGIFLGGPPPQPSVAPQGTWTASFGHDGYVLAAWNGGSDLSYMPGVTFNLTRGNRYQWSAGTRDGRALQSPDATTRRAATFYDGSQIQANLQFTNAYTGTLQLYVLDWDSTSRRETITVNDGSGPQPASLTTAFDQGAWLSFPINVPRGGTVTITITNTGPTNAVLSGIFLGGP